MSLSLRLSLGLIYKTYLHTDLCVRVIKSTSKYRFIKTVLDVEKHVSLRLVLVRVSIFPFGNTGVLQEFGTLRAPTRSFNIIIVTLTTTITIRANGKWPNECFAQ